MVCLKRGRVLRSGEAKNHQICDGGGVCRPQYKFYREKKLLRIGSDFAPESTHDIGYYSMWRRIFEHLESRHLGAVVERPDNFIQAL